MRLVFIAGRYTGDVAANIESAAAVAKVLWLMGIPNICPHLNSQFMENDAPYETFAAGYIEILKRCDILFAIPGWHLSVGARAEYQEAIKAGIPIVHSYSALEYAIKYYEETLSMAQALKLDHRIQNRQNSTA